MWAHTGLGLVIAGAGSALADGKTAHADGDPLSACGVAPRAVAAALIAVT